IRISVGPKGHHMNPYKREAEGDSTTHRRGRSSVTGGRGWSNDVATSQGLLAATRGCRRGREQSLLAPAERGRSYLWPPELEEKNRGVGLTAKWQQLRETAHICQSQPVGMPLGRKKVIPGESILNLEQMHVHFTHSAHVFGEPLLPIRPCSRWWHF
uniref:Uncharacterized protein n=1 Tax=Sus scrofa TaxID=9823 RepID=A0A4X1SGJ8_PIG